MWIRNAIVDCLTKKLISMWEVNRIIFLWVNESWTEKKKKNEEKIWSNGLLFFPLENVHLQMNKWLNGPVTFNGHILWSKNKTKQNKKNANNKMNGTKGYFLFRCYWIKLQFMDVLKLDTCGFTTFNMEFTYFTDGQLRLDWNV